MGGLNTSSSIATNWAINNGCFKISVAQADTLEVRRRDAG